MSPTMRVLVLLCFTLLRCGAVFEGSKICEAGLCPCERSRGRVTCFCTSALAKEVIFNTTTVPEATSNLRIQNCTRLRIKSHTWEGHRDIRSVELFNIKELIVESDAFFWNETLALDPTFQQGLSINIFNSTIPEIPSYTFKGCLNNIILNNVTVGKVNAFAFASLYSTEKLELTNCVVKDFEAQAFKKFWMHNLYINGGHFSGTVPSRTMLDLEVRHDFFIDKLTVDTIRSSAFIVKTRNFHVRDSYISVMEGETFRVRTHGKTLMQNNVFRSLAKGAFANINVELHVINREGLQELRFENNTIGSFENGCLIFDTNSFRPHLDHIILNQTCSCALLDSWSTQLIESDTEQRKHKPSPYRDTSNPANPFWCLKDGSHKGKESYTRFYDFSQECVMTTGLYIFLIIIVTSALALLAIILLLILWCRRRRSRNQRRWINVPTAPNSINAKSQKINNKGSNIEKKGKSDPESRITMIVPDGRTYRETELHVIVERTEPLVEPDYVDTAINERSTKTDNSYIETHH